MIIRVTLNGKEREIETSPSELLLELLRRIGLKGTKRGCGEGSCGACVVLLNGAPVNSCMVPAVRVNGQEVVTIEGIGSLDKLHPVQKAYIDNGAIQCGFCTSGSILSAVALLNKNDNPTKEEVKWALDGNLCRCTGYKKKIDAVLDAAQKMKEKVD